MPGFACKTSFEGVHDIAEFYVIPEKRGKSLGGFFAKEIFREYQGVWQVRQIEGAGKAREFWKKTIKEFSLGYFEEESINYPYWGRVTRQSFDTRKIPKKKRT